ncbi:ABC-type transport system involved in multi-copper enzyme maturation, permease component [Listeria fleischmannii subsp. fleischmannii]|uniref:ABC-type transport system involved in multi-copper enzyme maturation, permease component n=2 Tax=Listeria fleischmannii TaxID=1069827 RepID=A0A2X3GFI0_9LIST|nr:ABC transporter permease subunit [Listeria fleischmannii]SQC67142.1 ABC-type transport system involved in multi-copper enzyme maturation, permease component [Listeria fleischmannii subsp. fleischmannii]
MRNMYRFEWQKLIKRKLFPILLILVVSLVVILFVFYQSQFNFEKENEINSEQEEIQSIEMAIQGVKADPAESIAKNQILREYERDLKVAKAKLKAIKQGKSNERLKLQIIEDKNLLQDVRSGNTHTELTEKQIEMQIALKEKYDQGNFEYNETEFRLNGPGFTLGTLQFLFPFIFLIIFLLASLTIIGSDIDSGKLRFFWSLPIKKKHVFLTKELVALASGGIFLLITLSVAYLIPSIKNGFKTFQIPAIIQKGTDFYIGTEGEILASAIIMAAFIVLFLVSLQTILSLACRNNILSVIIIFLLIFSSGFLLGKMESDAGIFMMFNPFVYFDVVNLANGNIGAKLGNSSINIITGAGVLLAYTVVCQLLIFKLSTNEKLILNK